MIMESTQLFEQQLHQLSQLFISQNHPDFSHFIEQLEFQYYTQPIEFSQLIALVFELLSHPLAIQSFSTFDLYVFIANNFVSLNPSQQHALLHLISTDYSNYQQADVLRVINEIIGEKFANKAAWQFIEYLYDASNGQHHAQIPLMLARLIQYTTSIAIKRQAILMLQSLTQCDARLTRQNAQQTLQRTMRLMSPRVWRSLGLA